MSANTKIIQGAYDALAAGDVPGFVRALDPEIVWNEAESGPYADRNPYVGPEAVLEGVIARLGSEWDGFAVQLERLLDAGDSVVALGRYRGTHAATHISINAQFAHVWQLRDGRAVRFQQYTDSAQWRAAAGV